MSPSHGKPRAASRRRRCTGRRLIAGALGVATITAGSCDSPSVIEHQREVVSETGPELAVAWSALAVDIAYAEDQFLTFKGQRALAMMHLAMHDALQAIVPLYASYSYTSAAPDADPISATAHAAYDVIVAEYPDRRPALDSALAGWLDPLPDGPAKRLGEEVGAASARAILELREDDGFANPGTYTFRDGPGQYRTTPPWEGFTVHPGLRHTTPFSFDDPGAFRPPPPPTLDSPEYAAALDEVRLQGDSTSAARTADQTGYALWWMEFAESAVGRLARGLLTERGLDLWQANRVLARLYVALFDSYVSVWDSKYEYNHWRPYTAIRAAAEDGNPATSAEPTWRPLRTTPPFPEYVSAHATACAAAYEVMSEAFGDETAFDNTSLTAPPGMPTRSLPSFSAAAAECADSRVQLGWHYRYATDAGLAMGQEIAQHILGTTLVAE